MGLSAASVHVRAGSGPEAQERVAEVVRRVLGGAGYREVASAREADRIVILHPESTGAWLTLFDSEPDGLEPLAAAVSRETGLEAVCSWIEQSDSMRLALYRMGEPVDTLTAQGRKGSGRPAEWAGLLAGDAAFKRFRGILDRPTIFAEDKLIGLAGLLGLNRDLCLTHVEELLDAPGPPVGLRIHFQRQAALAV